MRGESVLTWFSGVLMYLSATGTAGMVFAFGVFWSYSGLWWLKGAEADGREIKWPLIATISGIVFCAAGPFIAIAWLPAGPAWSLLGRLESDGRPLEATDGERASTEQAGPESDSCGYAPPGQAWVSVTPNNRFIHCVRSCKDLANGESRMRPVRELALRGRGFCPSCYGWIEDPPQDLWFHRFSCAALANKRVTAFNTLELQRKGHGPCPICRPDEYKASLYLLISDVVSPRIPLTWRFP